MPANEYHFISNWRVRAPIGKVYEVLQDARDLPRWWPSVYLDALEIQSGDERGVAKVVRLETKGWLPYLLHWHLSVTEADPPNGFTVRAWGDFNGTGSWRLTEDGEWTNVSYDWRVTVNKPLIKQLSSFLKPVFAANHRWAMARGEESLKLELERRRATGSERDALPPPPGPTALPAKPVWLSLGVAAGLVLLRRRRRRRSVTGAK